MSNSEKKQSKIAIVHDWITNMGGAENVVLAFHEAFPDAPIYTSTYEPSKMPLFKDCDVRTTYLQKLPKAFRRIHKFFPMLRVRAFQKLDLSEFDVILSSSSAESKQVRKTRQGQIHICYCHTPIRYYWSHYEEYKKDPGFGKLNWLIRLVMPLLVPSLKKADYKAAQNVDFFIANSNTVKDRIKKYYNKPAIVIHPPVDVDRFSPNQKRGDYYVAFSRLVPYKRIDLAIKAANKLKIPLHVLGVGSEYENLVKIAGETVTFYNKEWSPEFVEFINKELNNAKGFIFPAEEDFGIIQVEAMAGGAPVIAYGVGGAVDIAVDGKTGILFKEQTTESLVEAIKLAEKTNFDYLFIRKRSEKFSKANFIKQIKDYVLGKI